MADTAKSERSGAPTDAAGDRPIALTDTAGDRPIALTGATGFVGKHVLSALLHAGYKVRALTRRSASANSENLQWISGDLHSDEALEDLCAGAGALLHLAGTIKGRSDIAFEHGNVEGTRNILAAAQGAGVKTLVHLSSLAAREPHLSPYARTKRQAEDIVRDSGLGYTLIRPPAVYGPGDRETLAFFRAARWPVALIPGGDNSRTSLIHVADLSAALLSALKTGPLDDVFEIAGPDDGGFSIAEIVRMIGRAEGRRIRCLGLPGSLIHLGARVNVLRTWLTGGTPMLSAGKARELTHPDWVVTDGRFSRHTGWEPQISAQEGLSQTLRWYRENGFL